MIDFRLLQEDFRKLVTIKYGRPIRISQHVQAVNEFCNYLQAKGAKQFSPTRDDVAAYFEYLSTRKNQKSEGTLSLGTINHHLFGLRILFKYLLDAGYFATHLANNGAGIYFIREFLGHSEIDTAQIYVLNRERQSKIN